MAIETTGYDWWQYFIIPWLAGIVGYGTNVVALQMTFYPLEFFGIELLRPKNQPWGLFGIQGIIPTKAEKMAGITFDIITSQLIDVKETFNKLDPSEFATVMEDQVLLLLDSIINDLANEFMPATWNKLSKEVRDEIIVMAGKDSKEFMASLIKEMQENLYDILDLKAMCVRACVANKALVNLVFQEAGDKEFTFIRRSGFYFGFLFGCIQMLVFIFYDGTWVLPVAGFIVGWFTNYFALKVIFRPLDPVVVCGHKFHGLFLQRQKEVSETFSRVICVEIMHVQAIWDEILSGPRSKNFYAILRALSIVFVENMIGELKPIAVAAMGADKFAEMKEQIAQRTCDGLPGIIDQSYESTQNRLDLERETREKLQALSPRKFERILHPAFEEDEILLIMVGGFLGLLVGTAELALFQ